MSNLEFMMNLAAMMMLATMFKELNSDWDELADYAETFSKAFPEEKMDPVKLKANFAVFKEVQEKILSTLGES